MRLFKKSKKNQYRYKNTQHSRHWACYFSILSAHIQAINDYWGWDLTENWETGQSVPTSNKFIIVLCHVLYSPSHIPFKLLAFFQWFCQYMCLYPSCWEYRCWQFLWGFIKDSTPGHTVMAGIRVTTALMKVWLSQQWIKTAVLMSFWVMFWSAVRPGSLPSLESIQTR